MEKNKTKTVEIDFYQDVKVTIWKRQYFTIKGETEKEVLEQAKKFIDEDVSTEIEPWLIEDLCESEEYMLPSENGGCSTIELFRRENKKLIGKNGD